MVKCYFGRKQSFEIKWPILCEHFAPRRTDLLLIGKQTAASQVKKWKWNDRLAR